jgi:hypothetical protein
MFLIYLFLKIDTVEIGIDELETGSYFTEMQTGNKEHPI